jgi:hypothetical protein
VLTPGDDLPALVVALTPLPEHDLGAVVDAAVILVAMEGVEVEVDVVHHADAAEPLAHVLALRPQHGLVQVLRVVSHKLHLQSQTRQPTCKNFRNWSRLRLEKCKSCDAN